MNTQEQNDIYSNGYRDGIQRGIILGIVITDTAIFLTWILSKI